MGGGTPSIFSAKQLDRLFTKIFTEFSFHKDAEKAIELNARNTDLKKLKVLEKHSFNKISLGVQSFSKRVLELNSRGYQREEDVRRCIEMVNSLDLNYLNVDMLLGLKGDTAKDFLETFGKLCKYGARHIVTYPLKTNDAYIKKNYGSTEKFEAFYYPLFDSVVENIEEVAEKHGYTSQTEKSSYSYVAPIVFSNLTKMKPLIASYAHFHHEPYSNFCLGFYSHSRISGTLDYRFIDKDNFDSMFLKKFSTDPADYVYAAAIFAPHFEKAKFLVKEFYHSWKVTREGYKKLYGTDLLVDFPYALRALKSLGIVKIDDEEIIFKEKDEKKIYPYMLFFSGRDWVRKKMPVQ